MTKRIYVEVLIWVSVSVFFAVKSVQLDIGTFRSPGPGFAPLMAALFLFLLSLVLIFEKRQVTDRLNLRMSALYIVCLMIGYALIFKKIGFLFSTFALMSIVFRVMGTKRWGWVFVEALLVTFASYLLFGMILGLSLPTVIF